MQGKKENKLINLTVQMGKSEILQVLQIYNEYIKNNIRNIRYN